MNIIEDIAQEFLEENYHGSENKNYFLSQLSTELARHRKDTDKVIFLSKIRDLIQEMHDEHYDNCKEREDCGTLKWYTQSIHYVNNILLDYSAPTNSEDIFTNTEKDEYSRKLDKILEEIEILKVGHEVIYEGISEEIEALKNLFFLGKKNWKQMVAGKVVEMVFGGVVSETISKDLIKLCGKEAQNLLQ